MNYLENLILIASSYMIVIGPVFSEENKFIDKTEAMVVDIELDKQSIEKRAEICIMKNVRNDAVMLVGTSTGVEGIFGGGKRKESTVVIPQGDIIKFKDRDAGIIVAYSRLNIKADFIGYSVQSSIYVAVKDLKFKITHKDIAYLQKNVGYGTPDEYKKLPKKGRWGSSLVPKALDGLNSLTEKIAACIQSQTDEEW